MNLHSKTTYTLVQYISSYGENVSIHVITDEDDFYIPLDPTNRHYAEIMRQVEAGELTIADAD